MIPDNAMAIGGMIEQQDEVRTQGRGMRCRSVCWVGATDALQTASAPGARNLLETARTRCGVGVCGVYVRARERAMGEGDDDDCVPMMASACLVPVRRM